ncbi:MAG: anti-sigma factor [Terriglobia bacterium]
MRCEELRKTLLDDWSKPLEESARDHLSSCEACRVYAGDLGLLRDGFAALAGEPVPEPSWGFTERLLRRMDQAAAAPNFAEEFFERVGRRVVYVAGMLALVLVLVLALPSSGPLRGPTSAELYWAQADAGTAESDTMLTYESADNPDAAQAPEATEEPGSGR